MQSSLVISVLLVCSGVIAVPTTRTADFSATELYRKHQSNVPTHLLYSASPQSYSSQAQHQPQTEKTSSHSRPAHQPSPGTIQSSGHVVSPSTDPVTSLPAAANHQSGGSETGGGSRDSGSGVAGLVGAPTGLGTGLGTVFLSGVKTGLDAGEHVGTGVGLPVAGAGEILKAGVGAAGQATMGIKNV
ncbi:hypothetical protein PGT21_024809 [Puccinia graminis f. sp. tritici]|uniref:Uncharacterized protein n=2 Tax=Puccinia graminis f. sp. tritici TaxID=56615 RepID=E3KDG6_PUCGT|nr:uncharacterized protein PGTG_08358 [Puccinia graminis f. sp. tritici CRL 75-36-700-3]EFP82402.1 hypothetical protein PGTG_08358 [Puccinia graminis f. sp. tritici CRL 75-36-700-3]KAA1079804.1 hypothetical protein PGT21_024809 [Puccinia graminis f. sp. tritici]KAA1100742.1 hypothetical protein PGTUg99_021797 [Puccinia graminis f. sp. tritici]